MGCLAKLRPSNPREAAWGTSSGARRRDLGLGVVGIQVEDGAMVGTVYETGPRAWRWDIWDPECGIQAFASGTAVTRPQAEVEPIGAAIDRIIEQTFGPAQPDDHHGRVDNPLHDRMVF
jgi:hypothetical protein